MVPWTSEEGKWPYVGRIHFCIYNNIQIFTLSICDDLSDTVEIRNELVICVEKVASVIEKLLEDEGEQHNKIQSEEIKRKQRPSLHYLIVLLSIW
jgi:hypothetical protein